MRIISATVGSLATANAASIAASQSGTAKTPLTLTANPVVLDKPRRVIITSAGNDTSITFAIVGTDWNGTIVSENLKGASGAAAQSAYDYATVTSITPSGNTAGNVTAGTNGVASTRPIFLDSFALPQCTIQVEVSGTVNATVQQSFDDPNSISGGFPSVVWANSADSSAVNLTGSIVSNFAYSPNMVRLLLNSGTGSATILVGQSTSALL